MCQLFPFFLHANYGVTLLNILNVTVIRWVMKKYIITGIHYRVKWIQLSFFIWLQFLIYRCISVYFPRRDIYSQRKTAKMTIAFCWIFPILLLSLPLTKIWGHFGLECGTKNCVIIQDDSGRKLRDFLGLFGFFLPLITLIICNIAIYIRVKVKQFFLLNLNLLSVILL